MSRVDDRSAAGSYNRPIAAYPMLDGSLTSGKVWKPRSGEAGAPVGGAPMIHEEA